MSRLIIDDAGRRKYKPWEKNDCSVRAFARVVNITYKEAYEFIRAMGRQEGKGYNLPYWLREAATNGYRIKGKHITYRFYHRDMPRYTIQEWIESHKKGRFIVQVRNHVVTIIDGVVYDDKKWHWENALVISYFRFV